MTYILYIWTVVAMAGDRFQHHKAMDWRPIGEYQPSVMGKEGYVDGKDKCEQAARQLGLNSDKYRCVRSK